MLTFDSLPQARVVRSGGQLIAPPTAPVWSPTAREHARTALAYAVGLWPLTVTMLVTLGLMWVAVLSSAR
jgi:hypothetical protein